MILLLATCIIGALLVFAIVAYFGREGTLSFGGLIRAEIFYFILLFLLFIMYNSSIQNNLQRNIEIY